MCCFHWLIKKLPWPVDRADLGRQGKQKEMLGGRNQSQGDAIEPPETDTRNFTWKATATW